MEQIAGAMAHRMNRLTEGRLGRIIYFFAYSLARLTTADLASNNAGKMMKARLGGYGTNPSVSELGVNIRWRWMDPCRKSMNGGQSYPMETVAMGGKTPPENSWRPWVAEMRQLCG